MNKVIVSSKALYELLLATIPSLLFGGIKDDKMAIIDCRDGDISFFGASVGAHYGDKDFSVRVEFGSLKKLFSILKFVSDQPITLSFNEDYHEIILLHVIL